MKKSMQGFFSVECAHRSRLQSPKWWRDSSPESAFQKVPEEWRRRIQESCPELEVQQLFPLAECCDHLLFVSSDDLVYRVDVRAASIDFMKEVRILRELYNRLPTPVPRPIWAGQCRGRAVMIYRKVPGIALSPVPVGSQPVARGLLKEIVGFLGTLHSCVDLAEKKSRDNCQALWSERFSRVSQGLFHILLPHLAGSARQHLYSLLKSTSTRQLVDFEPALIPQAIPNGNLKREW